MGRLEEICKLRGELLVEGWMQVRKFFPGVRTPLFRGAGHRDGAYLSLKNGIDGKKRSQWRSEDPQGWDPGYGIPFTRAFDTVKNGKWGDIVLVVDRDKVAKQFKVGPVWSPAMARLKPEVSKRVRRGGEIAGHVTGADVVNIQIDKKQPDPELEERVFAKHLPAKYIEGVIVVTPPYSVDDSGVLRVSGHHTGWRGRIVAQIFKLLGGSKPIVVLNSFSPLTLKSRNGPVVLSGVGGGLDV